MRPGRDPRGRQGRGGRATEELTHAGGVEVQTGNGTRRFPDARREDVPKIVSELVSDGVDIYEVTVIRSTLEDAYLEAVIRVDADADHRAPVLRGSVATSAFSSSCSC